MVRRIQAGAEPDRAVAGVDQDGQQSAALEAIPRVRARRDPDLAPEVEHPGSDGHRQSGSAEREKADIELPEPLASDVARGASRRPHHQDERREGADERDRPGRVEPAYGDRGGLHERDQGTRRPAPGRDARQPIIAQWAPGAPAPIPRRRGVRAGLRAVGREERPCRQADGSDRTGDQQPRRPVEAGARGSAGAPWSAAARPWASPKKTVAIHLVAERPAARNRTLRGGIACSDRGAEGRGPGPLSSPARYLRTGSGRPGKP